MSPTAAALEREQAFVGLARGAALGDRFEPVADRIADEVQDRIHHPLDQELVDLGVLAGDLEPHLLVRAGQVAHHERHAAENLPDRHHADPHHAFAQIPQVAIDGQAVFLDGPPLDRRHMPLDAGQRIGKPRPGDDQIADETHQLVEPRQVDADEMRRRSGEGAERSRCRSDSGLAGVHVHQGRRPLDRDTLIAPDLSVGVQSPGDAELERDAARRIDPRSCGGDLALLAQPGADAIDGNATRDQVGRRSEADDPLLRRRRHGRGRTLGRRFSERRQARRDAIDRRRLLPEPARGEDLLEQIGAGNQRIDAGRGKDAVGIPQPPQVALQMVRQQFRLPQVNHPGEPLE